MSKQKGKHNKKHQLPKKGRTPTPPPPPEADKKKSSSGRWGCILTLGQKVIATIVAILSLLSLVVFLPRLSASATPPLDPNNQLASSRFTITNDGYLKVTEVIAACFIWRVKEARDNQITSSLAQVVHPPEGQLQPTEGYTVPCAPEGTVQPIPLRSADLALVAYYRPWPCVFLRQHKLFRFVAHIAANGSVTWDKQPTSPEIEAAFDEFMQSHGKDTVFSN